jgi:sugar lactone lactonase YvrE
MLNHKLKFLVTIALILFIKGVRTSPSSTNLLPQLFAPLLAQIATDIEIVAKISEGPGNITVTPDGRIIISLHQFYQTQNRVVEVKSDGTLVPFPNQEWNQGRNKDGTGLDTVLGIQGDTNGIVWMLDNGMKGKVTPQLVAWNTRSNSLEKIIPLPSPVTNENSFVNDLAVDLTHGTIYIADTTTGGVPALIVVDLPTQQARRVLAGHKSVVAENIDLVIDGKPIQVIQPDGSIVKPHIGVNPIALDANNEWLYFGPMHGTRLYRIRTKDLLNTQLNDAELGERVEDYAERPISDGISLDKDGNIYITDVGNNAIGVILNSNRTYHRLISQSSLSWPNAFSFGPDGYMYTVMSQLQNTPNLNGGIDKTQLPFLIMRFKPLVDGVIGR